MTKVKIISVLAGVAMLALPVAAFASVNIQNLTLDGLANTTVNVGDTINAQATYQITSNDDVESLSWELVGSGLPQTCVDIPDQINGGIWHPQFDINTNGATAGSWDVRIKLYGVNGAGTDQQCGTSAKDTMTFTNRVAITEQTTNNTGVGNGTGNNGNGSASNPPNWFQQWLAAFMAAQKPATPAVSPKCAAIAPFLGAPANTYSSLGVQLQSALLLDNPNSISALAAGSTISMGYFGPQTHAALATYNATYHC